MSWEIGLYVCLVVWLASTLQGITGAGFNIISVPALVVILPAQLVVPGLVGLYWPLLIVQVLQMRADVDWRRLVSLAGGSVAMLPIGAIILRDTDAVTMQRIIGWSMIALAMLILVKPGPPFRNELIPRIGVGLIAGLLATSTSVSGPPVVLLGLKQRWEPARFRGTLIAYFLIVSTCALPFFWEMELLNCATLEFVIYGLPGAALGYLCGGRLRRHVTGIAFRWIAVAAAWPLLFCSQETGRGVRKRLSQDYSGEHTHRVYPLAYPQDLKCVDEDHGQCGLLRV